MDTTEATTTVTLGGEQVKLRRPDDIVDRMDVWELAAHSMLRARSAALGMAWTGMSRPEANLRAHRHNVSEYGAAVYRELVARGLSKLEIMTAGNIALDLVTDGLVTRDDIEAARGNSKRTEGSAG